MNMALHTAVWFAISFVVSTLGCEHRDYGNGATVCVCTKNKCDTIVPVASLPNGVYQVYTTSKSGARFQVSYGTFVKREKRERVSRVLEIKEKKKFQKIDGFGGAFTDSAGSNILSLTKETRDTLMKAYYSNSEEGIGYSMGRVPIGCTDFSKRRYSLDDVDDDVPLKFFALEREDTKVKIPIIQRAMHLANYDLKLFASAWTMPTWMKHKSGIGFLDLCMYDTWANYFIKFLDAYRAHGIHFWGLTTGIEPAKNFNPYLQINYMSWMTLEQAKWIGHFLGPKIRENQNYENIKIIIVEDQRLYFPWMPRYIMQNKEAASYIDGYGVHYYSDEYVEADVLNTTHNDYPDKFILATEACEGSIAEKPVILGSWERAERYTTSIIDDLSNWATGWMDWNIALNLEGGPSYVDNYVDSPIIVNKTSDEFYKQPMYYCIGHFSKFLRPESTRIEGKFAQGEQDYKHVVFRQSDAKIIVTIFNPNDYNILVKIRDDDAMTPDFDLVLVNVKARSVNTILYINHRDKDSKKNKL